MSSPSQVEDLSVVGEGRRRLTVVGMSVVMVEDVMMMRLRKTKRKKTSLESFGRVG